jgi:hypothetical protein
MLQQSLMDDISHTVLAKCQIARQDLIVRYTFCSRCLLNKHSASIQKSLLDTMRMILKFHAQIHSKAWQYSSVSNQYEHPRFDTLVQIYTSFHNLATFIFKFASKLANTGYQPCLHDLLLMLNINGFYPEHC